MDLKERLRALNGGRPVAVPPQRRLAGIESVLAGRDVATPFGNTYVVERIIPLSTPGFEPLATLVRWPLGRVAELTGDDRLRELDPARMIVLDTETTGLSGGTGTYTFIVGIGAVEGDAFVTRQYFLRGLTEEKAMLADLAAILAEGRGLLTYNGRSFDWPLLLTRFTLTRQRSLLVDLPHWDLLPLARRLWRSRVGSCSLSSLEASILRQPRADDTPGWLIPQLYFDYLRDGDARRLRGVFEHNHRDLIALAALAGVAGHWLADPLGQVSEDGCEVLAVARHDEAHGRDERAIALYRAASNHALREDDREAANRSLSLLLKRHHRWQEAVEIWSAMLGQTLADPAFPVLELAKYMEHVARDIQHAIALVEHLQVAANLRPNAYDVGAVDHRLARLRRRAALVTT